MSRVAKSPIELPSGVEFSIQGNVVTIKGAKGQLQHSLHNCVKVDKVENTLQIAANEAMAPRSGSKNKKSHEVVAIAGTTRAVLNNHVVGVSQGFEKKLTMVGVGYRAQAQGNKLNITAGFSHPVVFDVPEGITIKTPSQTEIMIEGVDKQLVGQVAADIRAIRPPEPYKGKGIRYANERISLKETKKK